MYRTATIFLVVFIGAVYCQDDIIGLCKNFQGRVGSDLIRDQRNCSIFYSCRHPNPRQFPMSCGWTTVFSQSQQVCVNRNSLYDDCKKNVYKGAYNGNGHGDPSSNLGRKDMNKTILPDDPLCGPHPFGLNRDPTDCSRFIPCFNHTSHPSMACQDGLHFSVQEQRCVEPGKSDCRSNNVNNGQFNNNFHLNGGRFRNAGHTNNPAG